MAQNERIAPEWAATAHRVRLETRLVVEALLVEGVPPKDVREAAIDELNEESARVRGNRPGQAYMTWEDARLCVAATLRNALTKLEER